MSKVTPKMERLRAAYLGEARGNLTDACRLAGYKYAPGAKPSATIGKLRKRHKAWLEALEREFNESLIMKGKEIDERLTALARDPGHRDHYKALELLAKMGGKLKDQVIVVDRAQLNRELDELVGALKKQRESAAASELPTPPTTH